jgi:hypothetical protein
MFLVLLVVPALTVVQADFGVRFRALRRVLGRAIGRRGVRAARLRRTVVAAAFGLLAALALVLGPVMVGGALPAWLTAVLPGLAEAPAGGTGLLLIMLAAGLLTGVIWLIGRRRA